MAAGRGGGQPGAVAALLLLAVLMPKGAASAGALPLVINTWAFRTAADTGVRWGRAERAGGAVLCCAVSAAPLGAFPSASCSGPAG